MFRLLAQDLAGLLTVERLADHLSALADLVLQVTIEAPGTSCRAAANGPPRFAVIAYGKLGGKELGYASDLDIVFLYDDPHEQAPEVYARLASACRAGSRPAPRPACSSRPISSCGRAAPRGLMVSPVEAFERYQERDAWVCGAPGADARALSAAARSAPRSRPSGSGSAPAAQCRRAAKADRRNARQAPRGASQPLRLFDVKHDSGGMIDVEFAVQFLVLGHAHEHPQLTGNLATRPASARRRLHLGGLAERARNAYREFRRLQHALRLNGAQYARVPRRGGGAGGGGARAVAAHFPRTP